MLMLALIACGQDAADTAATPTWHEDVEPIVETYCMGCHNEFGVGRGDFTSYDLAYPNADRMAAWVSSGEMPLPSADPECRPYRGHEHLVMADEDQATLIAWADGGAPEGDEQNGDGTATSFGRHLDDVDVSLPMPFTAQVKPKDDGNHYFCMVLDNPITEPLYVTGFDLELDNTPVVHHTLLIRDHGGDAGAGYGVTDTSAGFDCRDPIIENDWEILHGWAPGMEPVTFDDGFGIKIEPGDQLVLQMHYYGEPGATYEDATVYWLQTSDTAPGEVYLDVRGPENFEIPQSEAYSKTRSYKNTYGVDVRLRGIWPHMHLLGDSYQAWLLDDEGNRDTCLVTGAYDFDHQFMYLFDEPVTWPSGDKIELTCGWDNTESNPNAVDGVVTYGEGTSEEMCYFLYYASL